MDSNYSEGSGAPINNAGKRGKAHMKHSILNRFENSPYVNSAYQLGTGSNLQVEMIGNTPKQKRLIQ